LKSLIYELVPSALYYLILCRHTWSLILRVHHIRSKTGVKRDLSIYAPSGNFLSIKESLIKEDGISINIEASRT